MFKKAPLTMKCRIQKQQLECKIVWNDREVMEKELELEFFLKTNVKSSHPVNNQKTIWKKTIQMTSLTELVYIDLYKDEFYSYKWEYLDIDLFIKAKLDGILFFDKIKVKKIAHFINSKKETVGIGKRALYPDDDFNFRENFQILPKKKKRLLIIWASISLLVFPLAYVCWFVFWPGIIEMKHFFFLSGLSIIIAFIVRLAMLNYLNQYLEIKFDTKWLNKVEYGKAYQLHDFISGRSLVDIENLTVKIIAYNLEKGQHREKNYSSSSNRKKTVNHKNEVEIIMIHEETVWNINKDTDISQKFRKSFQFNTMFDSLHPPLSISSTHWVDICWDIQFIHDKYTDKTISWSTDIFNYKDFLNSEKETTNETN